MTKHKQYLTCTSSHECGWKLGNTILGCRLEAWIYRIWVEEGVHVVLSLCMDVYYEFGCWFLVSFWDFKRTVSVTAQNASSSSFGMHLTVIMRLLAAVYDYYTN